MVEKTTITAEMITKDFIKEQAADWEAAAAQAVATATVYLSDVQERRDTLRQQAQAYQKAVDTAKKKRAAMASKIVDLSSRGAIEEAAELDVEVEEQDRSISSLERKLRIVNVATPKGDSKLYSTAKDAHDAMEAQSIPYIKRIDRLVGIVDREIKRLGEIKDELRFARSKNCGLEAGRKYEQVYRHYHDMDRIEREDKEKREAERKAQEEKDRHTVHVLSY
jgi:predicted  nucleic acid-binding Zn-ribbon protein